MIQYFGNWQFVAIAAIAVVFAVLYYRLRAWMLRPKKAPDTAARCAGCGYELAHLEIPRCPECGALRGFKRPLDELGLTDEEVRSGFERMRKLRSSSPPPES